ncbi:hypothetical protein SLEP1_g33273 [Rubroshorea leprosula]|uniref:Uncharacterized protein n=1 Tax=Rubroshorea leprosula TaxID=152421 RepID=A0AAV5KGA3_9ROSI|nr:hypothetical protein SLEP1_g33273 [Rubroshorea leprosula]
MWLLFCTRGCHIPTKKKKYILEQENPELGSSGGTQLWVPRREEPRSGSSQGTQLWVRRGTQIGFLTRNPTLGSTRNPALGSTRNPDRVPHKEPSGFELGSSGGTHEEPSGFELPPKEPDSGFLVVKNPDRVPHKEPNGFELGSSGGTHEEPDSGFLTGNPELLF